MTLLYVFSYSTIMLMSQRFNVYCMNLSTTSTMILGAFPSWTKSWQLNFSQEKSPISNIELNSPMWILLSDFSRVRKCCSFCMDVFSILVTWTTLNSIAACSCDCWWKAVENYKIRTLHIVAHMCWALLPLTVLFLDTFNIIHDNYTFFTCYRPILVCSTPIWSPHSVSDIKRL